MAKVFLGVGTNIDRQQNACSSIEHLQQKFGDLAVSTIYESAAVGFNGDPFLNFVVAVQTNLTIAEVVDVIHQIEDEHGRQRNTAKFSARSLDIDLLLYDDLILEQGKLQLPRGEILEQAYVLRPLAELAGEQIHPILKTTYSDLWAQFDKNKQPLIAVDIKC